ncbi:MAG: helix-turn-helix domain-containing protein [Lacipirellulaceae bacterium]
MSEVHNPGVRLLTPREAAAALAVSPRKLWALTAGHEIPVVRIGRLVRYAAADIDAFIAARRQGGLR